MARVCVDVYECESSGGIEWQLEYTIRLPLLPIIPFIPLDVADTVRTRLFGTIFCVELYVSFASNFARFFCNVFLLCINRGGLAATRGRGAFR